MSYYKNIILFLIILIMAGCGSFKEQLNEMDFKPKPANISSEPVGADVYINGKFAGRTPLSIPLKPLGKEWPENWQSEIRVAKEGYLPQTRFVHLNEVDQFFELAMTKEYEEKQTQAVSGKTPSDTYVLPEYGQVIIKSFPDKAEIYIDNDFVGTTSSTELKLLPGTHKIVLKKKAYRDWSKDLKVIKGSAQCLEVELEKFFLTR